MSHEDPNNNNCVDCRLFFEMRYKNQQIWGDNSICDKFTVQEVENGQRHFKTKAPATLYRWLQRRRMCRRSRRRSRGIGSLSTVYFPCDIISIRKYVLEQPNRKFEIIWMLLPPPPPFRFYAGPSSGIKRDTDRRQSCSAFCMSVPRVQRRAQWRVKK